MSLQPRPLLTPALFGWVAGTALQLQQEDLSTWWVYMAVSLLSTISISFLATKKGVPFARIALTCCAAGLLAFALCGVRAKALETTALSPQLEGMDVRVQGVVAAMAQRNAGGTRFRLAVESAEVLSSTGESPLATLVPPLIYLGWYAESAGSGTVSGSGVPPDFQPGQRWQMVVRLKAPHGNRNPNGFDYELWLWEQGLQATGYVRAARGLADSPRLLESTWRYSVEQARQAVRDTILSRVADRRTAGIIAALVVGDQAAIERADWDVFRATGVAHLMSISGLHVTLFAWLAAALVGWGWRRSARLCLALPVPLAALTGGVLLAGAYALFSGWGVPAQRTVLMLATVGALRCVGLRWPWPVVWLAAMAAVLAWDPWAWLQAGFWLSFVAVGVLFAGGDDAPQRVADRQDGLETGRLNEPRGRFMDSATGKTAVMAFFKLALWRAPAIKLLREQAVVTLALTPLTLLLFGQVSVVGLLANLLAIPWVTLVVTPLAMLGVLWQPLWRLCGAAVDGLGAVLAFFANLPFATYSVAAPVWWISGTALFGGLILVLRMPWGFRALGLPLVLPLLLWQAPRPATGQFEVIAADVGQGTAVLVRTAQHSLLYDAGPRFGADSDAGHRVIVPWLRAMNESLDTLVLSHRDSDHTGGAQAVLAMQPQARLLSSLEEGHSLLKLARPQRCLAGQRWQWDGVDFEVLHPQASDYDRAAAGQLKPNGLSCVLRVSSAQTSALLTGDIERAQEQALLDTQPPDKLKADWLLVPHHGSKTSSSEAWLAATAPRWAVVQSGYRNRFGHPVPSVMQRYDAAGIQWVGSAHCGAASWASAAPDALHCERQRVRRYWQHRVP